MKAWAPISFLAVLMKFFLVVGELCLKPKHKSENFVDSRKKNLIEFLLATFFSENLIGVEASKILQEKIEISKKYFQRFEIFGDKIIIFFEKK